MKIRTILDTDDQGTMLTLRAGSGGRAIHLDHAQAAPILETLAAVLAEHKHDRSWTDVDYHDLIAGAVEEQTARIREATTLWIESGDHRRPDGSWDPHNEWHVAAQVAGRQIAVLLHYIATLVDTADNPDTAPVTADTLWRAYRLNDTRHKTLGR